MVNKENALLPSIPYFESNIKFMSQNKHSTYLLKMQYQYFNFIKYMIQLLKMHFQKGELLYGEKVS